MLSFGCKWPLIGIILPVCSARIDEPTDSHIAFEFQASGSVETSLYLYLWQKAGPKNTFLCHFAHVGLTAAWLARKVSQLRHCLSLCRILSGSVQLGLLELFWNNWFSRFQYTGSVYRSKNLCYAHNGDHWLYLSLYLCQENQKVRVLMNNINNNNCIISTSKEVHAECFKTSLRVVYTVTHKEPVISAADWRPLINQCYIPVSYTHLTLPTNREV